MARETRITAIRGNIQFYVRSGEKSTVPVYTGFEVDLETAENMHRRLGVAIRHAKRKRKFGK